MGTKILNVWFMNRLRYFNKWITNPITKSFAGKHVYAKIFHSGRKSGREYCTPVLAMPTSEGFIIPLPYGTNTDWCQNVFAADGCKILWKGNYYILNEPALIEPENAETFFPAWMRGMLNRTEFYLQLHSDCIPIAFRK